jgi:hypothetical protein
MAHITVAVPAVVVFPHLQQIMRSGSAEKHRLPAMEAEQAAWVKHAPVMSAPLLGPV